MRTFPRVVKASRRRGVVALAGAVLAGALAGPSTAAAAPTVRVDCPSDSLQAAIANAAPGTTLRITGTCTGHSTIDKDLSLLGQGTAVLDANGAISAIQVTPGTTASVTDLTITGADGIAGIDNRGTLTLTGSTVRDNMGGDGGGIDNAGSLTVRASTVTNNTASFGAGGIASIFRPELPTPALTLERSTVSDNHGEHGAGGISSGGDVPMTLSRATVTGNTSRTGAGGILAGGETTLNLSTVSGNTTEFNGGGIFVNIFPDDGNTLTLNNTTVSGNTAGGRTAAESPTTLAPRLCCGDPR
jgi:nitrous oxidase accessory protein NosD